MYSRLPCIQYSTLALKSQRSLFQMVKSNSVSSAAKEDEKHLAPLTQRCHFLKSIFFSRSSATDLCPRILRTACREVAMLVMQMEAR